MTSLLVSKRLVTVARKSLSQTVPLQSRSFLGLVEKYSEAYKRFGLKGSVWKLYNVGDVKFGYLVGEDEFGNKYYEDPTELHGQTRYTEFKVDTFDDFEGSMIPPQWHLWLQHITDAPPGSAGQDVSLSVIFIS